MSILEYLYDRYGKEAIDKVLYSIDHGDQNYKLFRQHITHTPIKRVDDFNHYHTQVVSQLTKEVPNKYMLYELVNILSGFDFTFKKYNTCITYGTFDLFHIGHLQLLKRIKDMCSTLIVSVSTDEFNELKGKKCVIPYEQRAAIVGAIEYVDKVIPEETWEQKQEDVVKYGVDAFVMGNDWEGKFDFLKNKCDVVYLPRTSGISTTQLKEKLENPINISL